MINAYLVDKITIKKITYDKWGSATETEISIKGRITFRTKLVRNLQGEQVVSSAKVIMPIRAIEHKDKIVYNSKEYSILNIEEVKDFSNRFLKLDLA